MNTVTNNKKDKLQ